MIKVCRVIRKLVHSLVESGGLARTLDSFARADTLRSPTATHERIFIELMTSDRKLKASRESSK